MPSAVSNEPVDLAGLGAALGEVIAAFPRAVGLAFERAKIAAELHDFDGARHAYRSILAVDATDVLARIGLAGIELSLGAYDAAIALFAEAAVIAPQHAALARLQGKTFALVGRHAEAREAFTRVLALVPGDADATAALVALDAAAAPEAPAPIATLPVSSVPELSPQELQTRIVAIVAKAFMARETDAAMALLDAILRRDATTRIVLGKLKYFVCTIPDYALGARLSERALELNPDDWGTHFDLAAAYELAGEHERAQAKWAQPPLRGGLMTAAFTGTGRPVRVLQVATATLGRKPHNFDAQTMQLSMLFTQGYDPTLPLPEHDIVYSVVADAEMSGDALDIAERIVRRTNAPLINPPRKIRGTSRVEQAARLATIPDVVIPNIAAVKRDALREPNAADELAARGFAFPLLVRSPGFQNGLHFEYVAQPQQLAAVAATMPSSEVLVIAYHDTRGADGLTRKMRVMMIDGQLYPLHLAISNHWKVHYYSSQNDEHLAYREEEQRFLNDMTGYLGARAVATLEAVARATNVDYGGIDFGLTPDGRVVVFEANACMSIFLPNADPKWDYRRAPMTAAVDAVKSMVIRRARKATRPQAGKRPKRGR